MCLFNPFCLSAPDMLVWLWGWFELQQWHTGSRLKLHVFWVYGWPTVMAGKISCFQVLLSHQFKPLYFHEFQGHGSIRSMVFCIMSAVKWAPAVWRRYITTVCSVALTGRAQVTALEWKWWASVTVARPPFQLWQVNSLIDFPWRLAGLFNATFPV